jgi:hypothetical protein
MTTTTVRPTRARRAVLISAWSIPVLIVGQFAMLAIVPVAIVVIAGARIRAVRAWAALLGALYATPLVVWALRTDPAQSLSKDIHPVLAGLVIAGAVAVLIAIYRSNRKA